MLTLTHAVTGAALGGQLGNPFFAFLGGIVLHFILDKVPHFWPKNKKHQNIIMYLDGIFAFLFLVGLYLWGGTDKYLMIAGALGGIAVDVLLVLTPLCNRKIGQWHSKRQPHKTNPWYYSTDVLLVSVGLYLVWMAL